MFGLDVGGLHLVATDMTRWAQGITAVVTHPTDKPATDAAAAQDVPVEELFTLELTAGTTTEPKYEFVTVGPKGNRIDAALADSALARVGPLPEARPAPGTFPVPASLTVGGLELLAHDLTAWAGGLEAEVVHPAAGDPAAVAAAAEQDVNEDELFTLTLTTGATSETYELVTTVAGPKRIDDMLLKSALVRATGDFPIAERPAQETQKVDAPHTGIDGDAPVAADYIGSVDGKTGIRALLKADLFNLLCIPPPTPSLDLYDPVWADAAAFCTERRAFLIVDPPALGTVTSLPAWVTGAALTGSTMRNAALYFPRICSPDPLRGGATATFAACGAIAGTFARIDGNRGVWKAPAGTDAGLSGVTSLSVPLTDAENGRLNPLAINCLRTFLGIGPVVWGARTLRGSDMLADEYKYVPIRRLALFLEETLYRSTQWVVFEPNDEPLWAQIRLSIGSFLHSLFRQGAFQGTTPREAYFVRCDRDTTTQYDIDRGIVNIIVGFAPLKPAEFVVIGIQQIAAAATA